MNGGPSSRSVAVRWKTSLSFQYWRMLDSSAGKLTRLDTGLNIGGVPLGILAPACRLGPDIVNYYIALRFYSKTSATGMEKPGRTRLPSRVSSSVRMTRGDPFW